MSDPGELEYQVEKRGGLSPSPFAMVCLVLIVVFILTRR